MAGKEMRLVLQGVGGRLQHYYDRAWAPGEKRGEPAGGDRAEGPRSPRHHRRARRGRRLSPMHLLAAKPGSISDGSAAVDLGQTPGDIVFLSPPIPSWPAWPRRRTRLGPDAPSLRLANLLQLGHNLSVDLYLDKVVRHARLVILRLLGGARYWPYGIEQLAALCRERGIAFAALPGDDQPDAGADGALHGIGRDDAPPLALLRRRRHRERQPSSALCRDADRPRRRWREPMPLAARRPLLARARAAEL